MSDYELTPDEAKLAAIQEVLENIVENVEVHPWHPSDRFHARVIGDRLKGILKHCYGVEFPTGEEKIGS